MFTRVKTIYSDQSCTVHCIQYSEIRQNCSNSTHTAQIFLPVHVYTGEKNIRCNCKWYSTNGNYFSNHFFTLVHLYSTYFIQQSALIFKFQQCRVPIFRTFLVFQQCRALIFRTLLVYFLSVQQSDNLVKTTKNA